MDFQATIRYGRARQRYLTLTVSAPEIASALRQVAEGIPDEVLPDADLVELREAPDFDKVLEGSDPP